MQQTIMKNKETYNRVRKILEEYGEENLDPGIREIIQGWLVSGDSEAEKNAALQEVYNRMFKEKGYSKSEILKALAKSHELLDFPDMDSEPSLREGRSERPVLRIAGWRSKLLKVAAVAIPVALAAGYFLSLKNNVPEEQTGTVTQTVAVNDQGESPKEVVLTDGSAISLSANSKIAYAEGADNGRSVSLTGEAVFTVTKKYDEEGTVIPFSVSTGNLKIEVLGTVFKVKEDAERNVSTVALYEGSVRVEFDNSERILKPGEYFRFNHETRIGSVSVIPAPEMAKSGYKPVLKFENASLGNLIMALEANYGVEFRLPADLDLSQGRITADFESVSLNDAVRTLSLMDMVYTYELKNDTIIITKKTLTTND